MLRLERLTLRNFKGARDFTLDARGADTAIFGDNATGKTTIADALMWVLFDKNSENKSAFGIKTRVAGETIPELEHEAEAILKLADGELLSLKKVYVEVRTKKRGSADREFTGHTTNHYVDGVPVQKGEYDQRVAALMDEGAFRLLTDPRHFNENLKWQERRKLLLEVCGDVSDADVIASDPELSPIPSFLGKRSIDDHRKVVHARRKEINEELRTLPARIDEVDRALSELADVDEAAVRAHLADLNAQVERLQGDRAALASSGVDASRLRAIDWSLQELTANAGREAKAAASKARDAAQQARYQLSEHQRGVSAANALSGDLRARIERLEARMVSLRKEFSVVSARAVEVHTPDTCPACRQALPGDRVKAAHDAAVAELNSKKAAELERIQAEGGTLKTQAEALKVELSAAERQRDAEAELAAIEQTLVDRLQAEADRLAAVETPDATTTPEYRELLAERAEVEARIAAGDTTVAKNQLDEQIAALKTQASEATQQLAAVAQRASLQARAAELTEHEKTIAGEYERLERELYLLDQFLRAKVSMLTDKINSRFQLVTFRLFEEQINEGLRETCEAAVDGIPYSDLNGGGRINAGLDIINVLADHYAFWPFIVIDNAESITRPLATVGQQIRLVVSEPDKKLRIETREEVHA